MKIEKVIAVYFSPTHTSQKVAEAIAQGTGLDMQNSLDLTCSEIKTDILKNTLVILAAPVYGGRVAPTAVQRIRMMKAENCPCVVVSVYGNRDYDDALLELREEASGVGLKPIAAAAFIGEHTFSTKEYPIAAGRPDTEDLQTAKSFGRKVAEKLAILPSLADAVLPEVKGNYPYRPYDSTPATPSTDLKRCTQCGHCIEICPTNAIHLIDDQIISDKNICIKCCACVKECPTEARIFVSPYSAILNKNFSARKEPFMVVS